MILNCFIEEVIAIYCKSKLNETVIWVFAENSGKMFSMVPFKLY